MASAQMCRWFKFEGDMPMNGQSLMKCPGCGNWYPLSQWGDSYTECETCGTQEALECPGCEESFDQHRDKTPFIVKNA